MQFSAVFILGANPRQKLWLLLHDYCFRARLLQTGLTQIANRGDFRSFTDFLCKAILHGGGTCRYGNQAGGGDKDQSQQRGQQVMWTFAHEGPQWLGCADHGM